MTYPALLVLTAGLVATCCGVLGPFLVLRREALLGDAMSHAVLPGIVGVWLLSGTRAPLPMTLGAAAFALACVLGVDALRSTRLVAADAAVGLVFPTLFALGVLGVQRYAADLHLDLDSTVYGELALTPFRTLQVGPFLLARSAVVLGVLAVVDVAAVALAWKELRAVSFDAEFSASVGVRPTVVRRALLALVAVTVVAAFESVGAVLVVCLLIVPAATAQLLADRLLQVVVLAVALGWFATLAGYALAVRLDASLAGSMGVVATLCYAVASLVVLARRSARARLSPA